MAIVTWLEPAAVSSIYYTKATYTSTKLPPPPNLPSRQQSIISNLDCLKSYNLVNFHSPHCPNLIPYQIRACRAAPTAVYLIVDRGQNSGAELKRTILAPCYHQSKILFCCGTKNLYNQHFLFFQTSKENLNLDRGGLLDIHTTRIRWKMLVIFTYMSWLHM